MDAFWIVVSYAFVFGTIALVSFGMLRIFGGGHWHVRRH
jgi:hypothetical protein